MLDFELKSDEFIVFTLKTDQAINYRLSMQYIYLYTYLQ